MERFLSKKGDFISATGPWKQPSKPAAEASELAGRLWSNSRQAHGVTLLPWINREKIQTGLTSYFGDEKERVEPATLVAHRGVLSTDGDEELGVCSSAHASEECASKCYINKKSLEDRQHFSDHASFSLQGEVREISLSLPPLL